jgi:hypothetical protein
VRIARELCVMGVSLGNGEMFQLFVWSVSVGLRRLKTGSGRATVVPGNGP